MIEKQTTLEPVAEEVGVDQTVFASQEPIYQDVAMPELPGEKKMAEPKKTPPRFIVIVLCAVGAIMTLLVLLLLLVPRSPMNILKTQASPSPSPQAELTEQQQRVKELSDELKAADPKKLDLPFPPVLINIGLNDERNQ